MAVKKKILFITGTRADYGKLKPLLKAIEASSNFENYIFVSGMHLLAQYGNTYNEVLKDNYKNVYVAFGLEHSSSMSINLGNTIKQLTGYVAHVKPDMIIVHGDRLDALAGAVVGALNNILVAHIEGGEVSGTIDESIRHAVSKFCHIHFTCNSEASKRLLQLGENSDTVYEIGSPDIDIMLSGLLPDIDEVKRYYGLPFNNYCILMYHPVTTEYSRVAENIKQVIDAVIKSKRNYVIIYPNNDLGSEIILNEYNRVKNNEHVRMFPSLRFEYFLTLLKHADCIIGNSSAGIRESCVYGIPAIDIGTRQSGRYDLKKMSNIQHVTEDTAQILSALKCLENYRLVSKHFGEGTSTEMFMEALNNPNLWDIKIQKRFIDLGEINV
ncbi:UDP-N-acetylglucosamine 2-epimerase [Dendrosporobacter sp. 1207_IL3150]|uniref:UDP-N-acetylglucosamine 2-epimerase n=1 Tax=Dendrosporobacter sp. 1207_IL3150 TaxID=3084054 RepID=UPI002FD9ADE8